MRSLTKSTDVQRLIIIFALLSWCAGLIAVRAERTGSFDYAFLIWNLFLAAVPLFASTCLRIAEQTRLPGVMRAGCFALWLLFLPNSPYILTDLLHLAGRSPAPRWYDLALLLSCSGTGLLMGYLSLADVQAIVAKKFGSI